MSIRNDISNAECGIPPSFRAKRGISLLLEWQPFTERLPCDCVRAPPGWPRRTRRLENMKAFNTPCGARFEPERTGRLPGSKRAHLLAQLHFSEESYSPPGRARRGLLVNGYGRGHWARIRRCKHLMLRWLLAAWLPGGA